MVNSLFEQEVRILVGTEAYRRLEKTEAYRHALKQFDVAIKPAFTGPDDRDKYVSFPKARLTNDPEKGLVNDSMVVTG